MTIDKQDIISAHALSSQHRELLEQHQKCGCFYCLEIFNQHEITDWTDAGKTALCPHCGIDAVIPETKEREITINLLQELHHYWFE